MNINTKSRNELRSYFKKNAIPTEGNFKDFIDAGVNQKDDGLLKPAGEPLSLEASLEHKTAIRFYETFAGSATWVVSLEDPESTESAFVLNDALGTPRLWIRQDGTVAAPGAITVGSLTTTGAITASSITTGGVSAGELSANSLTATTTIVANGLISARAGANVTGAALNVGTSAGNAQPLNVWGPLTANSTLIANSTATVTGPLNANGGLTVPAGRILTVSGSAVFNNMIAANAGANVTGAALNVGTSAGNAQPLNVWGTLTANSTLIANSTANVAGLLTATGGLTVTGAALNVGTSSGTAQPLTVWGQTNANAGANVTGAALNVGTSAGNAQPLNVWGTLTANSTANVTGLLTASGGLTVPTGKTLTINGSAVFNNTIAANGGLVVMGAGLNVGDSQGTAQPLNVWGTLTARGALIANSTANVAGLLTATGGLTVTGAALNVGTSSGTAQPLTVWGQVNANAGANVTGAALNVGASGNAQPLNVWGPLTANSTLIANSTATVAGLLAATGGLTVTGAALNVGVSGNAQPLNVWGTLTANSTATITGLLTASGGLSVTGAEATVGTASTPQALTVHGLITASGGLTVPTGKTLTVNGTLTANGTTSTGALTAAGALNANGGITIPTGFGLWVGGSITAMSGFQAQGADILLGPTTRTGVRLDKNASQYTVAPTIPASIPFNTGITVQAWIYLYSLDDFARIIDFGNGSASDNIIFFVYADGSLGGQVYKGVTPGSSLKSTVGILSLYAWTHVALTVDITGVMKLYKNGTEVGSTAASSANIPLAIQRTVNWLGRSQWAGNPYWNGILSEVSVWTGARLVNMNPLVGNETGLIAYWRTHMGDSCTNAGHIGNGTWQNVPSYGKAFDRGDGVRIIQEDWASPTLLNGWTSYSTSYNQPGYFKDSLGIVHLRGMLAAGTSGNAIFSLPSGYRPFYTERHMACTSSSTFAYVDISNSAGGNVTPFFSAASWVSLDGIRFRAI